MSEPSVELQRGIYSALTTAGLRAYDRVPSAPAFPYVTIPDAQVIDNGDTCEADMFEIFADIHVWSRAVGMGEAKGIAGQVRTALLGIDAVTDWTASVSEFQTARHMPDPDGLTTHSV